MEPRHKLLKRQIAKYLKGRTEFPKDLQNFLGAVSDAYKQYDEERDLLNRALELSSQELLQANLEMRAVFEAFPDIFLRLNSNGTILNYMASKREDYFIEPNILLGNKIQDIMSGEIGKIFQKTIEKCIETQKIESIEYSLISGNEENYYEARLVYLFEDQIIAIIRNITERKKGEKELDKYRKHLEKLVEERTRELKKYQEHLEDLVEERTNNLRKTNKKLKKEIDLRTNIQGRLIIANQRLKKKTLELSNVNEEIKRFAYMISHDLRSPLINIVGFAGELRYTIKKVKSIAQNILPQLDEKQRREFTEAIEQDLPEELNFIISSASRMDKMIKAVLTLSRIGRREMFFEPINMMELVSEILDSVKHQVEMTETRIIVDSLPDIIADRTSIEQIMSNLIGNAIKYLDKSRMGIIEINGKDDEDYTVFRVRDNGAGIPEREQERIFDLFYRVGDKSIPGEGMGLAYCRAMVRRHDGEIWCESREGEGSVFSFSISRRISNGGNHVRSGNNHNLIG